MADRLDRVNQGLSRENLRLKSQFKSQEDDRKFLIRQLVAVKVRTPLRPLRDMQVLGPYVVGSLVATWSNLFAEFSCHKIIHSWLTEALLHTLL